MEGVLKTSRKSSDWPPTQKVDGPNEEEAQTEVVTVDLTTRKG